MVLSKPRAGAEISRPVMGWVTPGMSMMRSNTTRDSTDATPLAAALREAQEEIGHFVAGKLASYVHEASTTLSVNLPTVQAPPAGGGYRLAHLHESVPGVLAEINRVLAEAEANVLAQSLATRGEQGYVVTDIEAPLKQETTDRLRSMPHTLRMRHLTP